MAASAVKVRQARAYLRRRGISTSQISPRRFASSSSEMGKSFSETLRFLAALLDERKPEKRYRQEAISAAARGESA